MAQVDLKELEQVGERVSDARAYLHIDDARKTLEDLDAQSSQPGFWEDQAHAQAVSKQASNLRDTLQEYDEALSLLADAQTAAELAQDDESFAEEAISALEKLSRLLDNLEMLRSENGVHRLVRISPTDAKARRQTTFAGVEVLPVLPDDIEVDLNPADVRVDVYRSSGPGGQCVNTTDSAVRLTHMPTGIVVTCQNEKSQLQNKEAAFRVLKAKLYELEEQKRAEELASIRGERMENSFGSQIRNYVLYPYQMVKDVRSGVETGNVDAVLDGDLDDFVIGYHRWRVSQ